MTGDKPLEIVLLEMFLLVLLGPLVTGFIQKLKARFQSRQGAGVLQPYRDLVKLLNRGTVQADTASGFFRSIPVLVLATTVAAGALVPDAHALRPARRVGLCGAGLVPRHHAHGADLDSLRRLAAAQVGGGANLKGSRPEPFLPPKGQKATLGRLPCVVFCLTGRVHAAHSPPSSPPSTRPQHEPEDAEPGAGGHVVVCRRVREQGLMLWGEEKSGRLTLPYKSLRSRRTNAC